MKLPKSLKEHIEKKKQELSKMCEYAWKAKNYEDVVYWNKRAEEAREQLFKLKVWAYGLAALSQKSKKKRKRTSKPQSVWAVVYGNYFPYEVDSLWATKKLALNRAEELGDLWEIVEMPILQKKEDRDEKDN